MDPDRLGGDAGIPGDLSSDFGERTAAHQGGRAPGDAQGGAQRGRHGLEVVQGAEHGKQTRENQSDPLPDPKPDPRPGGGPGNPVLGLSRQEDDIAAHMMREIEEAVAEIRSQFAGRMIMLQRPAEPPAHERLARVATRGILYKFFFRIQQRVRRLAAEKPVRAAAVFVALGLAFRAALRLRK